MHILYKPMIHYIYGMVLLGYQVVLFKVHKVKKVKKVMEVQTAERVLQVLKDKKVK